MVMRRAVRAWLLDRWCPACGRGGGLGEPAAQVLVGTCLDTGVVGTGDAVAEWLDESARVETLSTGRMRRSGCSGEMDRASRRMVEAEGGVEGKEADGDGDSAARQTKDDDEGKEGRVKFEFDEPGWPIS